MRKVADAVSQIIQNDETALESFREGYLNFSAYAEKIHPIIEKLTYKPVKKGTIVVALTRLSNKDLKSNQKPKIQISHLSTRSPLTSFTYQKTSDAQRRVSTLNPYLVTPADLFGTLEGESEIMLIASEKAVDLIKDHIGVIPKKEVSDLAAVTVQVSDNLSISQAMLNSLLSALSLHKVEVLGILPTSNEVSFIMDKNYMEAAISALNMYSKKDKKLSSKG